MYPFSKWVEGPQVGCGVSEKRAMAKAKYRGLSTAQRDRLRCSGRDDVGLWGGLWVEKRVSPFRRQKRRLHAAIFIEQTDDLFSPNLRV